MKKILGLLLASALLGSSTLAVALPHQVNTPRDQKGAGALPGYAGYRHMRNSATSEMVICSGRCLLAGLIMSTGPTSSYVTIRNSSVADGSGAQVIPLAHFVNPNTAPGNNSVVAPILLEKGITATINSVSSGEDVTVLYLDLD